MLIVAVVRKRTSAFSGLREWNITVLAALQFAAGHEWHVMMDDGVLICDLRSITMLRLKQGLFYDVWWLLRNFFESLVYI